MDRNFILAIVLSMGVLLAWDLLVEAPRREALQAQRAAAAEAAKADPITGVGADGAFDDLEIGKEVTAEAALKDGAGRVAITTPTLTGSINLTGGRIDDLSLKAYRETLDPQSPIIRLLSPSRVNGGQFVQQGWVVNADAGLNAEWSAEPGAVLTPENPVTLTRRKGDIFLEKTISVDEKYMFSIEQRVRNEGAEPAIVMAYGLVRQKGIPDDLKNFMILHEGPVGIVGNSLYQRKYKKLLKQGEVEATGERGWVGVTSKNWLAAAIPPQGDRFEAEFLAKTIKGRDRFDATYGLEPQEVPAGGEAVVTAYIFGGPKDVDLLRSYEDEPEDGGLGVWDFDKAVDWGNFFFLTRPIFYVLNFFGDLTGNFGVAILLMTLVIKAILFPLANKGFESMAKMKKLQPEVEKLRKRYEGESDKMKLQQEMMALYKKEKMNPLAGCLPILIQMPIFSALYKTLFVTIELRHEPFFGWIRDLSAPDPTTIFNLFGILPFDPMSLPLIGAFLGIGVLPILMGVAMWFQTKLNPPPPDPVQAQVFAMLPFIFVFLFASFASGLVLYWFWNTVLSIAQQYIIMRRNGVEVDWSERFSFLSRKKAAPASDAK